MSIKSPEYYLRRLNQIPQSAKQILHEIRKLDREVSTMQIQVNQKREDVIKNLLLYEERKDSNSKSEIEEQLKNINRIHKRMLKLTRKKKQLTEKLYNIVDDPTQQLERDLSNLIPIQTQASRKQHKGRRSKKDAGEQYFNSEPCYCYCKSPSFGLMVKCENQKCDTQWFHTHCLEDKDRQFEGKWYCRDCRKVRENRRSG